MGKEMGCVGDPRPDGARGYQPRATPSEHDPTPMNKPAPTGRAAPGVRHGRTKLLRIIWSFPRAHSGPIQGALHLVSWIDVPRAWSLDIFR